MLTRVAFSGRLNCGKDYVAAKAGFYIESVARPLYKLAEVLCGNKEYKKHSDLRLFLQRVGQWGWGYHDEVACPYTAERATFTYLMKTQGAKLTGMSEYDWRNFGDVKTFWIDGCIKHVSLNWSRDARVAVTNARFEHEIEPLRRAGFSQYLVLCTEETRTVRCGGKLCSAADEDVSEQYARRLEQEIDDEHVIWNDDSPIPAGRNYLTLERFCINSMRS